MKTKIIVSSASCLNDLYHYKSVGILNKRIKFSENEIYNDKSEMSNEAFFTRCKNDEKVKPEILEAEYSVLEEMVMDALNEDYEKILFILSENDTSLLHLVIDEYFEKNKNLPIEYIVTKLYLYPLAYAVRNIDNMLKHGKEMHDIREYIQNVENNFRIYFLSPTEDILPGINRIDYDEDIIGLKKGVLYEGTKDGISVLKKVKNNYPVRYLIDAYKSCTENKKTKKFVLYTNHYSDYIRVICGRLMPEEEPDMVSLAPGYARELGYNTVCFGFIIES